MAVVLIFLLSNPLNDKTMVVLFALTIIGVLMFGLLLGTEINSKNYYKRILYSCLSIICYVAALTIGLLAIADARFTEEIKCDSYEVKKVQEIKITDADTISTSHYILYNIKR